MPSTIMWHMRTDLPARIGFAHHWAETQAHHCAASGVKSGPLVHCAAEHVTSCTGAHWRHCHTRKEAFVEANCSLELVELKREASLNPTPNLNPNRDRDCNRNSNRK